MENNKNRELKNIIIRYFDKLDNGDFDEEYFSMFSDDFTLESAKFGLKKGIESLSEFGNRLSKHYKKLRHLINEENIHVVNKHVFAEGTLTGETFSGILWPDNKSSYGKFCSVFEFDNLKIRRISIYADPDFASEDAERVSLFR